MPWRVTSPMYQHQRYVLDAEHTPASDAELCPRVRSLKPPPSEPDFRRRFRLSPAPANAGETPSTLPRTCLVSRRAGPPNVGGAQNAGRDWAAPDGADRKEHRPGDPRR